MKRILFFAAATAVALSSCSKNEVILSSTDNQAIGFGVYTGVSTKGTEVTTTTLGNADGAGFGVLAYYHEASATSAAAFAAGTSTPNFMYNQQVIGNGVAATDDAEAIEVSAWSYSPVKYWPNDTYDRISFFAYAPYTLQTEETDAIELSANTYTALPTLTYTTTAADIVDLVVADPLYDLDKASSGDDVAFTFQHVLTRLNFSAWANVDANATTTGAQPTSTTSVYVTDLQIVGKTNGTLLDKNNATTQVSNEYFSTAKFTFAAKDATTNPGTWAQATTEIEANTELLSLLNKNNTAVTYGEETTLIAASTCVDVTSATKTSPATLLKTTNTIQEYVFMLPPNGITGLAAEGGVKIYIQYKVVTEDENLTTEHSVITNQDIVSLPAGLLKQGVAYNINLELGLTEVKVSATVADWDVETVPNTDVATPDAATATTTVTASAADAAALKTALTSLNDAAATSSATDFYVEVSGQSTTTLEVSLSDIEDVNFKNGNTITFTFTGESVLSDFTITDLDGFTVTKDSYEDGNTVTFNVATAQL